ncbi:MAG: Na+/H+ antiporter NhaC family protein [Bacilli bacterium]|nr:Na+/H+ antiporter NhaC family protein [Bacilli bacterium]
MTENQILKINKKSFIIVCIILGILMTLTYILTYLVPKGEFVEGVYQTIPSFNLPVWKWIGAPVLVLGSDSGLNIIVISLFIIILSGSFQVMNKTDGISSIIGYLVNRFSNNKKLLMSLIVLLFMGLGAFFGIFEEAVTLLPIIVLLALSLGWDTFTGLGMCLLAAGFGFSTAITNPFSIGLGSTVMGISLMEGMGYRLILFFIMYGLLLLFLFIHIKKIEKKPQSSITYESDEEKRKDMLFHLEQNPRALRVYTIFFLILLALIILSSILPFLQGYSIPIIALAFLVGIFICGLRLSHSFLTILKWFLSGMKAMAPAIIMILMAASIQYILNEGKVLDTLIYQLESVFAGGSKFKAVLFIYLLILIIQFFIGSASAKIPLLLPILSQLATNVGITKNIALLAFVFGDGFTDLIYPTNPVLLIALGMVGLSYPKWFKKTGLLQLAILIITVVFLYIAFLINY